MKRLLTTLVILTSLIGSGGAVWAQDFNKGLKAAQSDDFATALKEWKPLAEHGSRKAQFNLGNGYIKGEGVTQGDAKAVKWYRKAAELGLPVAQFNLGAMYEKGKGVSQDTIAAHVWFNIAAANGNKGAGEERDKVEKCCRLDSLKKLTTELNAVWMLTTRIATQRLNRGGKS